MSTRKILIWLVALVLVLIVGAMAILSRPTPSNYTQLSKPFDTGNGSAVAIRLENRVVGFANKGDTVYMVKLK
jgi:hypothetical protein